MADDVFSEWFGAREPTGSKQDAPPPAADGHGQASPASINEPTEAADEPAQQPECAAVNWEEERVPNSALDHARGLIARGCKLVPVYARTRKPVGNDWQNNATDDIEQVSAWLDAGYIYGVAGGHPLPAGGHLLIVDLDVKDGKDGIAELAKYGNAPETFTVRSPSGGLHLYFTTWDAYGCSPGGFRRLDEKGRDVSGIDIRGRGGHCVGPGCTRDGKPYEVICDAPIAEAPAWLVNRLQAAREHDGGNTIIGELDTPERIDAGKAALADPRRTPLSVEGQHGDDNLVKVVAQTLFDIGVSVDAAHELLTSHPIERDGRRGSWNDLCSPPWSDDELLKKCHSAWTSRQDPVGSKFTAASEWSDAVALPPALAPASAEQAVSASDGELAAAVDAVCDEATLAALLRMSPLLGPPILAGQPRTSPPWLVKKTIPRTGAGMIFGPSTGGKSYVVMDLAAKLWQGTPWFGAKVPERRATVIFAFEGGEFAGFRLDALEKMLGDKPGIVVIPAGRMTPAGLRSCIPQLRGIDKFCRARFGLAVGLVVIDTVSAAGLAEKEDKADDVAPALKAVQEFAGTVGAFGLLVHHPNKGGAEMRGSGAWFNNTDVVLKLDVDSGGTVRTLTAEKVKDGPSPRELGSFMLEPITLGRDEDGEPIEACVVRPAGKPAPQTTAGVAHFDKFVRAFEDAADRRGASRSGRPIAPISEVNELFRDAVAPSYKAPSGVRMAWKRCFDFAERASIIRPVRGERNTYELTEAAYAAEDPNAVASQRSGRPEDFTGATTF